MVQPTGKHLPFKHARGRRQAHGSDRGDGGAARADLVGGERGGRSGELPSLRTEPGPGGTGKTATSRRFDFAEGPSGGWHFVMSAEPLMNGICLHEKAMRLVNEFDG
jgi:hypothetical protein